MRGARVLVEERLVGGWELDLVWGKRRWWWLTMGSEFVAIIMH